MAFTGALSMVRHDAAVAAANAGCQVEAGVTKHTTLLVVGDQDISRLVGHERVQNTARRKSLSGKASVSGLSGRLIS
jgi:DNA polymerase-3 subunit epsilon